MQKHDASFWVKSDGFLPVSLGLDLKIVVFISQTYYGSGMRIELGRKLMKVPQKNLMIKTTFKDHNNFGLFLISIMYSAFTPIRLYIIFKLV